MNMSGASGWLVYGLWVESVFRLRLCLKEFR